MDPDPTDLLLLRGHALLGRDTEIEKQVRARPDGGGGLESRARGADETLSASAASSHRVRAQSE